MASATLRPRLGLSPGELDAVARARFGDPRTTGPLPRLWHRARYFIPDVFYEGMVAKLVTPRAAWLDVGCGRDLFPGNDRLARELAGRCRLLVGVDPDGTVAENDVVHVRVRCPIEEYDGPGPFDVVTLRMVAEHVTDPDAALAALARLTRPGGKVVVYTINRWSPVPVATRMIPFRLHHPIKQILWRTEEKDTFPVAYRMNTRPQLRRLFERHGFREAYFARLPDCRTTFRFRLLHGLELLLWRALDRVGLTYPENCLLGIYERV
jgi:SAM-dependent methyltransferase